MFDDFYGLDARPFQLTPDPAFYFESSTHRKALSYLGYGLAQGEGFVVITGEVGAGKSTLVAYLMATIDPARMTAANVVTSALDGEEIVHVVAQSFGLPVMGHDKASALGTLEAFFHDEARAGRRCLLIVDEAQNLSVSALEELRMLSNFQLGSHPLLQTLLLGQPEFRETLLESNQLEQLRQRVIATHHLGPMHVREVQPYVEHRLGCVGWKGNPSFDAALFPAIHEATGGIPRRINQIVNRLLLLGAVDRREHLDAAMLEQVLDEMNDDGALAVVTKVAEPEVAAAQPVEAAAFASAPVQAIDTSVVMALIESALADREALDTEGATALIEAALAHRDMLDTAGANALIEAAMAGRDTQIGELHSAIAQLTAAAEEREASARQAQGEQFGALEQQLADAIARSDKLEARLGETERTLRHTLTMLIEWIESGDGQRNVA
ncbi:XrtA/PEP-CTERM system-associated ATPase [Novosphingobium sp. fls2-241-R2A-195]|jgi:putative secretion ATPase (PEP-CTERM system associated)|uniref:XrtA/PEP-CTERM system-associated ATPase n=1 Tax=Novosphingobium sp. fls2-241-R2A-195 TaxID=3040296 RepID=UPI00254E92A0|nr:XrtA/PEP-CTERM system-associated ATPase [Novosphingobium sp. fls2-241-R2A-195]